MTRCHCGHAEAVHDMNRSVVPFTFSAPCCYCACYLYRPMPKLEVVNPLNGPLTPGK